MNFWRPGISPFKALQPNELFLFKLKKPYYAIVGGGYFVGYSQLSIENVWETFELKNGTRDKKEFYQRIAKYRKKNNMNISNLYMGCIVLTEPFFFNKEDWVTPMSDWSGSIVQGKTYDTTSGEGKRVYEDVIQILQSKHTVNVQSTHASVNHLAVYYESMTKHRIGQGAFRVVVTDAYSRTCAVTGEKVSVFVNIVVTFPFYLYRKL